MTQLTVEDFSAFSHCKNFGLYTVYKTQNTSHTWSDFWWQFLQVWIFPM